jgi:uncharacterized protein YkwD
MMKIKVSFALAGLAVLLSAAAAQQRTESPERQIFNAANDARRAQGLMRLKWNEPLARAARQHADVMARQNALSHQFPNEPALPARASRAGLYFISIAENVAQGPDADNISDQWVRSPEHRQNLLDPEMNVIGIGIAERDGELFAVEDLAKIKPQ